MSVSHAAPAHYFGDKAGLPTAVATDGFAHLAATLRETYQKAGSFLEVGVAYVRFAVTHRAHFEVMFRPELYRTDDPDLVHARDAARSLLYPPAAAVANSPDGDEVRAAVAAWSLVHGLATLWLNWNLPPQLGDDPEQITREVVRYLFRARGWSGLARSQMRAGCAASRATPVLSPWARRSTSRLVSVRQAPAAARCRR
jgi:AcrR family transcriptional regulator